MFRKLVILGCAVSLFIVGGIFSKSLPGGDFWKIDISGFLGMIASISTAVGVAVAIYFGKRGLDTWKHQNKASIDNELVRRISLPLMRYADAMLKLRHPVLYGDEMAPAEGETDPEGGELRSHRGNERAYRRRLEVVNKERLEIYAGLLESQFFWGQELTSLFDAVFAYEREFTSYLRVWLQLTNPGSSNDEVATYRRILDGKRNVLYDDMSDEGDWFRQELNEKIEVMKNYLKTKLVY